MDFDFEKANAGWDIFGANTWNQQWTPFFIVNFEHISYLFLVFLL